MEDKRKNCGISLMSLAFVLDFEQYFFRRAKKRFSTLNLFATVMLSMMMMGCGDPSAYEEAPTITSSALSGGLRNPAGEGFYVDTSSSAKQEKLSQRNLESSHTDAYYPLYHCTQATSEQLSEWSGCSLEADAHIPRNLVDELSEKDLHSLVLAVYKVQNSGSSEDRKKAIDFLNKYKKQEERNESSKFWTFLGAWVFGSQTTLALSLKHVPTYRLLVLPRLLRILAALSAPFSRSMHVRYGSLIALTLGGGAWLNGMRIQQNRIEGVVFQPGEEDDLGAYATLEALLDKSMDEESRILEVENASRDILALDHAIEMIEESQIIKEQAHLELLFYQAIE